MREVLELSAVAHRLPQQWWQVVADTFGTVPVLKSISKREMMWFIEQVFMRNENNVVSSLRLLPSRRPEEERRREGDR